MRTWQAGCAAQPDIQQCAIELLAQIGQNSFNDAMLAQINHLLPVGSWSVYRTWADQPPILLLSHSFQRPDITLKCFQAYKNQIYLEDRSFETVRASRQHDRLMLQHLRADEFKNPRHREMIYTRNRLCERLSISRNEPDGSVTSVNLYTHEDQPSYTDRHLGRFENLAPILFTGIERHLDLSAGDPGPGHEDAAATGSATTASRRFLENTGMSPRELDVCERLLQGMTYDGIAADMGLGRPTVITYRNRAFARLGISFKSQLFALLARHSQHAAGPAKPA
jgi:DNA-binding CsgD family transcriptional regulator